jgi:hypothetical protein
VSGFGSGEPEEPERHDCGQGRTAEDTHHRELGRVAPVGGEFVIVGLAEVVPTAGPEARTERAPGLEE